MPPIDAIAPSMRIDLYSHGIKVWQFNHEIKNILLGYCRGLAEWGKVRISPTQTQYQMIRVYAGTNRDRSVLHFHRNQLEDILRAVSAAGYPRESIKVVEHSLYEAQECTFELKDTRPPREYQLPIIDYLAAPCPAGYAPAKVVTLQTGKGKTFLALQGCHRIGKRVFMVIKGMYVDKWKEDVESAYHLEKGDLMIVRGSDHLAGIIQMAKDDTLKAKWIICTVKTMFNYIKAYEHDLVEKDNYDLDPVDFYKTLKVGVRLIDEVHQEYHMNFRQDLYTHVPCTISLSATLDSDSQFLNHMYSINWPRHTRAPEIEYDRFIAVYGLWFSFRDAGKIRYKNFMKQYSHVIFEESIMRNQTMWENYMSMIAAVANMRFISKPDRAPWEEGSDKGQSLLILCSTIKMCTALQRFIQDLYPQLKVNRYVEDDSYEENFLKGDIVISTIQSAGTAVDRPNLRVTLMTTALSSKQSNIQVLGRTRKLKDWPDITPEFIFLSARDIDKHRQYTEEKQQKLSGKVKSFAMLETNFRI